MLSSDENTSQRKRFLFRNHSLARVELCMNGEWRKGWGELEKIPLFSDVQSVNVQLTMKQRMLWIKLIRNEACGHACPGEDAPGTSYVYDRGLDHHGACDHRGNGGASRDQPFQEAKAAAAFRHQ